jgi:hypothetical protein
MKRQAFIAIQSARLATLLFLTPLLLGATAYRPNETRLAFLSDREKAQKQAVDLSTLPPAPEANPFDGRWIFTGADARVPARCRRSSRVAKSSSAAAAETLRRTVSSTRSAPATE